MKATLLVYNHLPTGRGDDYDDLTGLPQFLFGFARGPRFAWSALEIAPATRQESVIRCTVVGEQRRPPRR
ncbi:MAG: hypothetical protein U0133_01260 [Gemmatimonadales bacterium]